MNRQDEYTEPTASTMCIGFDEELGTWFGFMLEDSQVTASWELVAGSVEEAWTEAHKGYTINAQGNTQGISK